MFEVMVKSSFSAAHSLKEVGEKCETLHGHNFVVEVSVTSMRLNEQGVVIDFRELKSSLGEILELIDHTFLNEITPFIDCNPSSEHIARFIHEKMREKLKRRGIDMPVRVNVWESDTTRASYWEDRK